MSNFADRQDKKRSHSSSYGEAFYRSILVKKPDQIARLLFYRYFNHLCNFICRVLEKKLFLLAKLSITLF